MIGSKWFHEPDDERESWCFLTLGQKGSIEEPINGWRIGYGNPTKMVRTLENEGSKEREVIRELLEEFHYCRQENITLITDGSDVLQRLRTRILMSNVPKASFKGIRHISIENILKDYFEGIDSLADLNDFRSSFDFEEGVEPKSQVSEKITFLWKIFLKIGPLLPKECFRGKRRTL